MATNNLLVNNEKKVLYDIQKRVERSGHNLSQSRKFPAKVGYIYPFFCRKTLPSDSFKISTNILIKQLQPFLVPQMVSFTVNTAFYWVDYQLAFPQFEHFLINQRGQQNIELPYVHLSAYDQTIGAPLLPEIPDSSSVGTYSTTPLSLNLRTFLDITSHASNEKVDALPFWAYQTIYRDFYLNIDRLSDSEYASWFPSNPNDWKLKPGENFGIGSLNIFENDGVYVYSGDFQYFDQIRVHNVRGDYFVNSYPTPLRGDIPTLQVSSEVGALTADFSANLAEANYDFRSVGAKTIEFGGAYNTDIAEGSYPILVESTGEGAAPLRYEKSSNLYGLHTRLSDNAINLNVWNVINSNFALLNSAISRSGRISLNNISNLSQSFAITSRQLRFLESLTRKREIDILMKPRLKNYLQTYFDVKNYQNDSLYQPVFIGSTTQQILINDINQTTATSDSPLGRQGATAMSLGSGYVGEYFCRNYGCLMGVMYILPDYDYEPAIPREWSERTPDDFYNPEFSHLSMQAILNKELFSSNDPEWNNQVLGYAGIYDNYRTSQNLVCGDLLNSSMLDVQQFAQVRRFNNSNKPEITTAFLNSASAFDASVFSVPSLPPFIAQCVTRVEAVRPIPEVATPRDS